MKINNSKNKLEITYKIIFVFYKIDNYRLK